MHKVATRAQELARSLSRLRSLVRFRHPKSDSGSSVFSSSAQRSNSNFYSIIYNPNSKLSLSTAFTLIELIIVIAVIGILSGIVLVSYNGVTAKARDTALQNDVDNLSILAESYKGFHNGYPDSTS